MNTLRWTILAMLLTVAAPSAAARGGLDTHVEAAADLAVDARAVGRAHLDYSWDWGDGEASAGASARHEYRAPGHYRVVVTATDEDGREWTRVHHVHVRASPKPLDWRVDADDGEVRGRVHAERAARVEWDWGDGATGRGARASHHYEAAGEYEVTVKVTRRDGECVTERRTIVIDREDDDHEETHRERRAEVTLRAPALSVEVDIGRYAHQARETHSYVRGDASMHVHANERRDAPGAALPLVLGTLGAIGALARRP